MRLTILILLISASLKAPSYPAMVIPVGEVIMPYARLIYATGKVECNHDTLAYNPHEKAVGYFQIRPIRVNDYNKRSGSNFKLKDMYDYKIAEKVFLFYAEAIGPYDLERISKNWNGSGIKTISYWEKVRAAL